MSKVKYKADDTLRNRLLKVANRRLKRLSEVDTTQELPDEQPVAQPAPPEPPVEEPVEEPVDGSDAEKIRQAKVRLFFDKLENDATLMNYLSFNSPLEQAEAITQFASLVGVPKGQLLPLVRRIRDMSTDENITLTRGEAKLVREALGKVKQLGMREAQLDRVTSALSIIQERLHGYGKTRMGNRINESNKPYNAVADYYKGILSAKDLIRISEQVKTPIGTVKQLKSFISNKELVKQQSKKLRVSEAVIQAKTRELIKYLK